MATFHLTPEHTSDGEYHVHVANYRAFLKTLWSAVAGISLTLIVLALLWG